MPRGSRIVQQPWALVSLLNHQLPFLEHVHQFDSDQGVLGCVERFEPQHRPCHPLYSTMVLLDHVIQIFHLADDDVRAVFFVRALDRGFIGLTAVNRDLFGDPMAVDRFLQKLERRLLIPMLGEQKINGLAGFIHRTIEIAPLPFDADVGLIHPPAAPHRLLAVVKRLLQLRAVLDDPTVDGGVIHVDTALEHELFDVARAQRVGDIPADARQDDILWEMGPLKFTAISLLPFSSRWMTKGDHTSNGLK
jgi:hypothetical protein